MVEASTVSKLDKITFKDWLLALIGLLFTLGGLLIIQKDFKVGITALAFFGSCFAVFLRIILRKLRLQRQSPLTAIVVGGEPIRPSRVRIAMLGLGLMVVGTILALFQPDDNNILFGCALLMAIAGGVLLVGLVTGLLSKAYIQFDPPGITFGYWGGKATVPWSAITNVARGEIHNNQAVFIWVPHEAVTVEPSSDLAKIHKQMTLSKTWAGADFVIMSSTYGIDAPILLAAIKRYITSPEARAELRAAPKLGMVG
jgi:hypothetical protein